MHPLPSDSLRCVVKGVALPTFFLLATGSASAQIKPSGGGSLLVQPPGFTYVLEDFLPAADALQALLRTEDGFLWMTSKEGLIRFDGYDQVCFRHPLGVADAKYANWFSGIVEDQRGDLWLGSLLGLQKFDRGTEN